MGGTGDDDSIPDVERSAGSGTVRVLIGPIDGFIFRWNQSHTVDVHSATDPDLADQALDCFSVGDYAAGPPSMEEVIDDCYEWDPADRLDPDLYGHLIPSRRDRGREGAEQEEDEDL